MTIKYEIQYYSEDHDTWYPADAHMFGPFRYLSEKYDRRSVTSARSALAEFRQEFSYRKIKFRIVKVETNTTVLD